MRVVISGSSGLIGTALVPHLRSAGHEVVRLVRRTPQAPDERGWDPPSGRTDAGALDGADAVINLSGAGIGDKRWTGARKQELRDSRLVPTDVLARAVAAQGIPLMINGSAVGFYGDTGAVAVDESGPRGRGFLADLVRDWENATAPATEAGARVVTVRTGLVLSPAGGLLGIMRPIVKAGLGGRLGSGEQFWPWVSLDDEVGAITYALEHDSVVGPVNATGPSPVTCTEFTKTLASALHRPAPWVVPGFAMRAVLGEFADEGVLVSQRVLPGVLEREGYTFQHASVTAALSAVLDG
ncbi:TIGR01777 family oxidoreductase [Actinomycetospora endophytica]|uniref:TIGR01777 family oxidoreductase n=1 Tax=Actinomycetospora endophytica TaxID=2291215 RepID=A0ABS8PE23_9PSEU|nr:TIGR01777 family oxidoreductase [Actinomycetospora endophytica]MCD2196529.1 TIGR01777 family oxidoreductase [Actinomycetospora endophytica]